MHCRLCECPTADGAVRASQVDQLKLRKWALKALKSNGCDIEFNEVVEDDDLICYFCIWQCEYVARHESTDESLAWWPKDLRLDVAAKALRKNFFEGKVDQCWVELEKIKLPEAEEREESADEGPAPTEPRNKARQCVYCRGSFKDLRQHIKKHRRVIRCDNLRCATYFRTKADKEAHMADCYSGQSVKKAGARRQKDRIQCTLCVKRYSSIHHLRRHVALNHADYPIGCSLRGCKAYFKTRTEMKDHYLSAHNNEEKPFKCEHCLFSTSDSVRLSLHTGNHHLPKVLECDLCKKMFATVPIIRTHMCKAHSFYQCESCKRHIKVQNFTKHAIESNCTSCKKTFACSGKYQLHLEHCFEFRKDLKNVGVQCGQCEKWFKWKCLLRAHITVCPKG